MDKQAQLTIQLKIGVIEFTLEKTAFKELMDYFDALDENFAKNDDREEIIADLRIRAAEILTEKLGKRTVVDEADVQEVISRLGAVKKIEKTVPESAVKKKNSLKDVTKSLLRILGYVVYWTPHILWVMYFFGVSIFLFTSIVTGPESLTVVSLITYAALLILPLVFMVIGGYLNLRKRLKSMLLLLFGVEVPVFLLSIFRIFIFQHVSTTLYLVYLFILVACAALILDETKWKFLRKHENIAESFRMGGLAIGTFISGYIFAIWFLFTPAILRSVVVGIGEYIKQLFNANAYNGSFVDMTSFAMLPLIALLFVTVGLFYFSPAYVFVIYLTKMVKKTIAAITELFAKTKHGQLATKQNSVSRIFKSFKPFIPILAVASFVLLFILTSINYTSGRQSEITAALANDNLTFEQYQTKYEPLYQNEFLTKWAIKDQYFLKYSKLFDDKSTDMFNGLYCQDYSTSNNNYGYSTTMPQYSFSFDKQFCRNLYSVFSSLVYPVVHQGSISTDSLQAADQYKKVFDDDIQRAEKADINQNIANTFSKSVVNSTFGRVNSGVKLIDEDQQFVSLNGLQVNTNIDTDQNTYVSTYTFDLSNNEVVNQEIYLEFSLPEDSVISDLKLGMNLDKIGIVAPKAAAKTVYEKSLVRNIDPALLELIGPRTYRLRVFPIPFSTRSVTNQQRVQFQVSGIVYDNFQLVTFPYTRNLKITDDTKYEVFFNYSGGKTIPAMQTVSGDLQANGKNLAAQYYYRVPNNLENYVKNESPITLGKLAQSLCYGPQSELDSTKRVTKMRLFFDISKSASNLGEKYQVEFAKLAKANPNMIYDVYLYNFQSKQVIANGNNPAAIQDILKDLNFWGYTDKTKVMSTFANYSNDQSATYIFSDDSDFEYSTEIDYNFNYARNRNNTVNIYQFGSRLTGQREELTNLVLSSGGKVKLIPTTAGQVVLSGKETCTGTNKLVTGKVLQKLDAFNQTSEAIGDVMSQSTRSSITRTSTITAKTAGIVDSFNSMIAVDNDWQKEDLQYESQKNSAYNQNYDIGAGVVPAPGSMMAMPEGNVVISAIALFILMVISVITRRRFLNNHSEE